MKRIVVIIALVAMVALLAIGATVFAAKPSEIPPPFGCSVAIESGSELIVLTEKEIVHGPDGQWTDYIYAGSREFLFNEVRHISLTIFIPEEAKYAWISIGFPSKDTYKTLPKLEYGVNVVQFDTAWFEIRTGTNPGNKLDSEPEAFFNWTFTYPSPTN